MMRSYVLLFLLFCVNYTVSNPDNIFDVTLQKKICVDYEPNVCVHKVCKINLKSRNKPATVECLLARKITEDVKIRCTLFYKFNTYKQFLFDLTGSYCDFMSGSWTINVAQMAWAQVIDKNMTNLGPCPLEGLYYLRDFVVNTTGLPYVPSGDYRADFSFIEKDTTRLLVQAFFNVKAKGAYVLAMG